MKYPIGIQTFEKLREGGYVYVDKTALAYKLVSEGGYYFLSRPRRFGKSLLLSTLRAYFEAKRELFKGLAIEKLETEWTEYAVLYIDFNTVERGKPESLNQRFEAILSRMEKEWKVTEIADSYPVRFENIIHAAAKKTEQQVVILIDEYDKPMLNLMERNEPADEVRERLKAFYSVLKAEDRYIRFAMLTGVTRFSKVSVFSDLNNLEDISMAKMYAGICGITEQELHDTFDTEIGDFARELGVTKEACYAELRRRYDGYHFSRSNERVYNPFSVLNTLKRQEFSNYWFATGTPTFLIDVMKRTSFDFTRGFAEPIAASTLCDVDSVRYSPVPILFQSGYLTIRDYDPRFDSYTLGYPNSEVKEGFVNFLLPHFTYAGEESANSVSRLVTAVESGDAEGIVTVFKTLFDKRGNYMLYEEKSKERDLPMASLGCASTEQEQALLSSRLALNFRNILYMVFSLLDIYTSAELCTSAGRMDISVETKDYVYVIELKLDKTAEAALQQIKDNGYAKRFLGDPRQLILLGVNFSTKTNSIDGWAVEA